MKYTTKSKNESKINNTVKTKHKRPIRVTFDMLVDSARKYKTKGRMAWASGHQSYYVLAVQRKILNEVCAAADMKAKWQR